jgi:hypothetical protein
VSHRRPVGAILRLSAATDRFSLNAAVVPPTRLRVGHPEEHDAEGTMLRLAQALRRRTRPVAWESATQRSTTPKGRCFDSRRLSSDGLGQSRGNQPPRGARRRRDDASTRAGSPPMDLASRVGISHPEEHDAEGTMLRLAQALRRRTWPVAWESAAAESRT